MDQYRQLLRDLGLPKDHGLTKHDLLRRLAAAQDSQFSNRQALSLGLKPSQILALRDRGEIERLRQCVWRFRSAVAAADPAVTAFLACWPNGVISHASAAGFHGLTRVARPGQPEISVLHGGRPGASGIAFRYPVALDPVDVLRVGPLRYTSLARTVCDLADPAEPWESLSILDDAVAAGARPRWIHDRAEALWKGRSGVALIRAATRPGASDEFRSWLERAAAHVLAGAGLPMAVWNAEVRDSRGRIGIVDALWPQYRVICELKGLRFHSSPNQVRRDDQRLNRLLDASYSVRTYSWRDVVDDAPAFAAGVARALRAAGAALDPAAVPSSLTVPDQPFLLRS